jgi:hypothetical protein
MAERQRWCLQRRHLCLVLRPEAGQRLREYLEHPDVVPDWNDVEFVAEHWDTDAPRANARAKAPNGARDSVAAVPEALKALSLTDDVEGPVDPITLGVLRAPYTTPCGHVYSALAIVRHLLVTFERSRPRGVEDNTCQVGDTLQLLARCPVCTDWFSFDDLRPYVSWHSPTPLTLHSRIRMRLLCRPRGCASRIMLPRDWIDTTEAKLLWSVGASTKASEKQHAPAAIADPDRTQWHTDQTQSTTLKALADTFCQRMMTAPVAEDEDEQLLPSRKNGRFYRVLLGEPDFVEELFASREAELQQHLMEDETMELAHTLVMHRERARRATVKRITQQIETASWSKQEPFEPFLANEIAPSQSKRLPAGVAARATVEDPLDLPQRQAMPPARTDACPAPEKASIAVEYVGLYQIADGRQVYMHPQNYRALLQQYGSVEKLPLWIQGSLLSCYECRTEETKARAWRGRSAHASFPRDPEASNCRQFHLPVPLPPGCVYFVCKLAFGDTETPRCRRYRQRGGGNVHPSHASGAVQQPPAFASRETGSENPFSTSSAHRSVPMSRQTKAHRNRPVPKPQKEVSRGAEHVQTPRERQRGQPRLRSSEPSLREVFEQERQHIIEAHGGAQLFFRDPSREALDHTRPFSRAVSRQHPPPASERHEIAEGASTWPALSSTMLPAVEQAPQSTGEQIQASNVSYARIAQVRGGYYPTLRDLYGHAEYVRPAATSASESKDNHKPN